MTAPLYVERTPADREQLESERDAALRAAHAETRRLLDEARADAEAFRAAATKYFRGENLSLDAAEYEPHWSDYDLVRLLAAPHPGADLLAELERLRDALAALDGGRKEP